MKRFTVFPAFTTFTTNRYLTKLLLGLNLLALLSLNLVFYANYSTAKAQMSLIQFRRTVTAKTADYTVAPTTDTSVVFTTTGAGGAVNFTLPTITAAMTGAELYFFNTVDQDMTLTAQTAGQLIFKNDVAANSVAYSTTSEKIGGGFYVVCTGAAYLVFPLAEEAQTITVTT